MSKRPENISALAGLICSFAIASTCLWDYDTLKQERARFPTALELITGKFLRHSTEFYEWRIQDRLKKLQTDPANLGYHDDLAVAYQKTGQHAKAVETMMAKEQIKPGLYETCSNLGTFYILAGDFDAGLPYIDKALAINPDAHFGRERYQKWLVEYALAQRKDGKITFPLRPQDSYAHDWDSISFHNFLKQRLETQNLSDNELQRAVKGVLGMMRFANHDNPLLLEALGDLLRQEQVSFDDAKRLATRCYLKASYAVKTDAEKQGYRMLANQALNMQTPGSKVDRQLGLTELETEFAAELADADKWYADLKSKEIGWIRDGKDPEAEFDRLYTEEPTALDVAKEEESSGFPLVIKIVIGAGMVVILLFCIATIRSFLQL